MQRRQLIRKFKLKRFILLAAGAFLLCASGADARRRRARSRRVKRAPSAKQLVSQLQQVHADQIQARGDKQRQRADTKALQAYSGLVRMLRSPSPKQRKTAEILLVALVQQASYPGQNLKPRLFGRLTIRNHDRFNATIERDLRWLLQTAARFTRGTWIQRQVARKMVAMARAQEFGSQVALMRANRRLGHRDEARWIALQAILSFKPSDRLVLDREAKVSSLDHQQITEIAEVLWTARSRRDGGLAFMDLRRADARYFGWTAAPRLQAIAYLARRARGWPVAKLAKELKHWQPAVSLNLSPGAHDKWIPARYGARKNGRGLGYLVAAKLLARRP